MIWIKEWLEKYWNVVNVIQEICLCDIWRSCYPFSFHNLAIIVFISTGKLLYSPIKVTCFIENSLFYFTIHIKLIKKAKMKAYILFLFFCRQAINTLPDKYRDFSYIIHYNFINLLACWINWSCPYVCVAVSNLCLPVAGVS
jgi:hypothetical protein